MAKSSWMPARSHEQFLRIFLLPRILLEMFPSNKFDSQNRMTKVSPRFLTNAPKSPISYDSLFTSQTSWLYGFQDTEGCKALPPILSSWRLRHAIEPNGFAAQFPHAAGLCNRELLDAVEEAATKPGRRTLPSASAPVAAAPAPPPPPPPPAETATATSPKAAAPVGTSASARPASPTKAGWKWRVTVNLYGMSILWVHDLN